MKPIRVRAGLVFGCLVLAGACVAAQESLSYEAAAQKQELDQRDQQFQQSGQSMQRRQRADAQWQALRQREQMAQQDQRAAAQQREQTLWLQRDALERQAVPLRQSMAQTALRGQLATQSLRQLRGQLQARLDAMLAELASLAEVSEAGQVGTGPQENSSVADSATSSGGEESSQAGAHEEMTPTPGKRAGTTTSRPRVDDSASALPVSKDETSVQFSDGDNVLAATLFTGPGSPKCLDLDRQIRESLYRDKRLTKDGGKHGVKNRLNDQVTGKNGPNTKSWTNHEKAFEDAQANLRNLLSEFAKNRCGDPPRVAWKLATRPAPKPSEWRGPQSTTFLGARPHPLCVGGAALVAIPSGMMGCVPEAGTAALLCSPAAEIPVIPVGCAVVGCGHGAVLAGGAAFAAFERACSAFMSR